ncbi:MULTISPECIES: hypothetical protein [unclassified Methylobacterium]|jgi:hypothetical protein|uniref:hypothetical protein n=1 Tax=unclassified Methylobacterium TaxID=2615210 RepID=UPI001352815E|nr:hypothetical protein [Methylobacterium sp. 2A]MWV22425.1 hypothetical protein [Methylobacterium sp. 2A]
MPGPTDVYWNRTRKLWSLREDGRVVGHVPAVILGRVTFHASEPGRQRWIRTGERTVHAYARGYRVDDWLRPLDALRLRYAPQDGPGFVVCGQRVARAVGVWFEPDGSAWAWGPA